MANTSKGSIICNVDFPLYTVASLDDHYFMIAGGGGRVKSGVLNAMEIYKLVFTDGKYSAELACQKEMGLKAVMNSSCFYNGKSHVVAAGMEDECHIYDVKYKILSSQDSSTPTHVEGLRHRAVSKPKNASQEDNGKFVSFDVVKLLAKKTDFAPEESFQKVVRFSRDHSCLATGGADGCVRIWKYPTMEKLHEIEAHECDIDDLDFSMDDKHVASLGRDGTASVWNVSDGSRYTNITWTAAQWEPYRCRACRYGDVVDKDKFNFYTINIPSKRRAKRSQCYISKWNTSDYRLEETVRTGTEILSALAVSHDGTYLGIGTISGSVSVYIAFSLQKIYNMREIHDIFVTGLDFVPSSDTSFSLHHNVDCTMLSISADNTVRLHQIPSRDSYSIMWVVVGAIIIIVLALWILREASL